MEELSSQPIDQKMLFIWFQSDEKVLAKKSLTELAAWRARIARKNFGPNFFGSQFHADFLTDDMNQGRIWGGMRRPSLLKIQPPADPKGPPLYYFEISIFG